MEQKDACKLCGNLSELRESHVKWSTIIASLIFSFSTYAMLSLYSIVHWKIMLHNGTPPDDTLKNHVYMLLDILMWLRIIFAVLAAVYAWLSFVQGPKVLAFLAL
ncbi:MAG: hypothetical protein ACYSTO_10470, partial [Planctomycetota bacterium]